MKLQITPITDRILPVDFELKKAHSSDAGYDLMAWIEIPRELLSGEHALIPAGFKMALPVGYEAQIRPRSGLALKKGITVLNAPGTIDADYRGEVGVVLINHGTNRVTITPGMRIAQMVIAQVEDSEIEVVEKLDETDRGSGGFGSSGE